MTCLWLEKLKAHCSSRTYLSRHSKIEERTIRLVIGNSCSTMIRNLFRKRGVLPLRGNLSPRFWGERKAQGLNWLALRLSTDLWISQCIRWRKRERKQPTPKSANHHFSRAVHQLYQQIPTYSSHSMQTTTQSKMTCKTICTKAVSRSQKTSTPKIIKTAGYKILTCDNPKDPNYPRVRPSKSTRSKKIKILNQSRRETPLNFRRSEGGTGRITRPPPKSWSTKRLRT